MGFLTHDPWAFGTTSVACGSSGLKHLRRRANTSLDLSTPPSIITARFPTEVSQPIDGACIGSTCAHAIQILKAQVLRHEGNNVVGANVNPSRWSLLCTGSILTFNTFVRWRLFRRKLHFAVRHVALDRPCR